MLHLLYGFFHGQFSSGDAFQQFLQIAFVHEFGFRPVPRAALPAALDGAMA
jgi:hypothetical protein